LRQRQEIGCARWILLGICGERILKKKGRGRAQEVRGARLRYGVADEAEQENEEEADGERGGRRIFFEGGAEKFSGLTGSFLSVGSRFRCRRKNFFRDMERFFCGMQKNFGRTEKIFPRSIKKFSDARPKLNPGIKKF